MTDTRGPGTGKVPPHVKDRLDEKRAKAEQRARKGPVWARPPVLAALALVGLLIGFGVGRGSVASPEQAAADEIAEQVLPLANEAEGIWRVGVQGQDPMADAALALETQDDITAIDANIDAWIAEHQRILDALDATSVGTLAAPLRDLFTAYVRAQLDGAVLLGAAAAHDGSARQELFRAAVREIGRSRTLLRQARIALEALGGPATPGVEVPAVPGLTQPGDPLPSPFQAPSESSSEAPTDDASPDPDAGASPDPDAGASPDPDAGASPDATPSPS